MSNRFRVGRKVGRTIYLMLGDQPSDDDRLVGVMDTPQRAAEAVRGLNSQIVIDDVDITSIAYAAAGQLGNENPRGIEITHLPTGLVASSDSERTRLQNTVVAMRDLRAALTEGVTPRMAGDDQ